MDLLAAWNLREKMGGTAGDFWLGEGCCRRTAAEGAGSSLAPGGQKDHTPDRFSVKE